MLRFYFVKYSFRWILIKIVKYLNTNITNEFTILSTNNIRVIREKISANLCLKELITQ